MTIAIYCVSYDAPCDYLGETIHRSFFYPTLTEALGFIQRSRSTASNWRLARQHVVPGATPETLCNALNGLNWVEDSYELDIEDGSTVRKHAKHVDP